MWIVWLLLCLFGAAAPSAFIVSPSLDLVNVNAAAAAATSAVVNMANSSAVVNVANSSVVVDASSLPVANVSAMFNVTLAMVNATTNAASISVPQCALIVKLVNSTRHEFQIAPVECPAPEDYWLAAPQMVHFESSDLIEVTCQKDVVIGNMVKFVVPSEAAVCRFTRGVRFSHPPGYTPFQMMVVRLKSLYNRSAKLWRESIYGISPPSPEAVLNEYVAQIKKGPELPQIRDDNIEQWAALAAKDLGEAKALDVFEDYQQMDDYTWEIIQESDDSIPYKRRRLEFPLVFNNTKHAKMMLENQERRCNIKNNHIIPWDHWLAKTDPYQPMCESTRSQVEEARSEAVSIQQFRQTSARSALIPGGSGDGQDPDDNRGPPRKELPGDKIGSDDEDDEEKRKKKRKKGDEEENTRLVRITRVTVLNTNQVSTLIFFLFLA
jgi:hypothetical protein